MIISKEEENNTTERNKIKNNFFGRKEKKYSDHLHINELIW